MFDQLSDTISDGLGKAWDAVRVDGKLTQSKCVVYVSYTCKLSFRKKAKSGFYNNTANLLKIYKYSV